MRHTSGSGKRGKKRPRKRSTTHQAPLTGGQNYHDGIEIGEKYFTDGDTTGLIQRQRDIERERTRKGFLFIGFLDMMEATGTEMGTRKKSKQRLYDYYFDSPWCPLFGSLLDPNYLPNSTVSKAVKVIEQARLLWDIPVFWCDLDDIEICHMYVEPEAFSEYFSEWTVHYPHYPGFKLSKELLISARRIFWEGINISTKAQLAYSESHPIWDKDKDGNPVEYLAPDQAGSSRMMIEVGNYWEVSRDIKEWQVYSILGIRWAYFMLKLILKCDEPENDPKMIEHLRIATSFLSQAIAFKEKEAQDEIKDLDDLLEQQNNYIEQTEDDRQRGTITKRSASKGGKVKAQIAKQNHDDWQRRADRIFQRFPSYKIWRVAGMVRDELIAEQGYAKTQDWISRKIKKR